MTRSSRSLSTLPPDAVAALGELGQRLRAQRLAQNQTIEQTAARLLCSPSTYRALENGQPTVSLGLLVHALWLFGRLEGMEQVCALELSMLGKQRVRASTRTQGISDDERNF